MRCEGCGNEKAYEVRSVWVPVRDEQNVRTGKETKYEQCNACGDAKPGYARDALGNRVYVPPGETGRFSYATGTPILSSRQYASEMQKQGLAMKEG